MPLYPPDTPQYPPRYPHRYLSQIPLRILLPISTRPAANGPAIPDRVFFRPFSSRFSPVFPASEMLSQLREARSQKSCHNPQLGQRILEMFRIPAIPTLDPLAPPA